ncbi:MAG: hypothetical protein ACXAEN_00870 [Candidatus Thorarchaeota archaeon]|jgi:hypothetical protein
MVSFVTDYLYIYDCTHTRRTNARRVSFTKELYGFNYSWKTKTGIKTQRKPGLLDTCIGSQAVADSAILVPENCRFAYDELFRMYQDIVHMKLYQVLKEM